MVKPVLRLYVSGEAASSRRALQNFARLCELYFVDGDAQVIDVAAEPHLAEVAQILATPTLVYDHPANPKRIIGDLSDMKKVLDFLGIERRGPIDA